MPLFLFLIAPFYLWYFAVEGDQAVGANISDVDIDLGDTVYRRVHPVDVVPTIAAVLGMTSPGSAQGSPLKEVLK